jgi:diguanylate cyclase
MSGGLFDFSPRGWGRVILWTVVGTLACVAVALYVDSFNFATMDDEQRLRAILVNILLPVCLAVPMLLFLTIKLRELAIAHHELSRLASTDSLTSVLNRGAFTALVEGYLAEVRAQERETKGALLLIDADNFKSINDAYGHDSGDVALRLIAERIRASLRGPDIVGRIGGEEFGVFLPGSTEEQAETVAERIRRSIAEAGFVAKGTIRQLSVSVGGAVFDRRLPFGDLFRLADQQLYAAKQNGRNRVSVTPVGPYDPIPAAAA